MSDFFDPHEVMSGLARTSKLMARAVVLTLFAGLLGVPVAEDLVQYVLEVRMAGLADAILDGL